MMSKPVITSHTLPIPHISVESHGMLYEYTITFYECEDPEFIPETDIWEDVYGD